MKIGDRVCCVESPQMIGIIVEILPVCIKVDFNEYGVLKYRESDLELCLEDDWSFAEALCGDFREGIKHDTGKPQYSQIPAECLEALADVLTMGADKYDDFNWQKVPEPDKRYYDALMRHLHAWRQGETMDESGKTHLQCVFANAMFLLWGELHK